MNDTITSVDKLVLVSVDVSTGIAAVESSAVASFAHPLRLNDANAMTMITQFFILSF